MKGSSIAINSSLWKELINVLIPSMVCPVKVRMWSGIKITGQAHTHKGLLVNDYVLAREGKDENEFQRKS